MQFGKLKSKWCKLLLIFPPLPPSPLMTISTRSWAHCWSHYQDEESLYLWLDLASLNFLLAWSADNDDDVDGAACELQLKTRSRSPSRARAAGQGGRVFICEINKNYSLSRATSGNTPVGHVATPGHIYVRCSQTERNHKEFPSLLLLLGSVSCRKQKLDKHGVKCSPLLLLLLLFFFLWIFF